MSNKKRNRLIAIVVLFTTCCLGTYILLANLRDNIVFFYTPSEMVKMQNLPGKIRVGGIVKNGSILKGGNGTISFIITDYSQNLMVTYQGLLPALFRENQGIVAEGILNKDTKIFLASKLLIKHDENYRPPNIMVNPVEPPAL